MPAVHASACDRLSDDTDAAIVPFTVPSVYVRVSVIIATGELKLLIIGVDASIPFAAAAYQYHVRRNGVYVQLVVIVVGHSVRLAGSRPNVFRHPFVDPFAMSTFHPFSM
jgi:acetaldehyde dehydrogenase (acetylating)